ncbi:hypothetical protein VHEMI01575 [[Torrubiella] hemipterigena]|uniref:F-box domain-containing protein n=1 Tax=[Torrubiella] hemipterigena TaxID=1531966 RepID=A0A0A1SM99_9HYPO|nr:hypothetical protein VHEMI01575 [[Torrubiella] hemipterigena]
MDSLPLLLLEQISEDLERADLESLRLVNKFFAAIYAEDLFTELHFTGEPQKAREGYAGRTRSAQCANLDKAVVDILPIACYVGSFISRRQSVSQHREKPGVPWMLKRPYGMTILARQTATVTMSES